MGRTRKYTRPEWLPDGWDWSEGFSLACHPSPGGAVYIEVCHDCFMVYRYTMDLRRDPLERVTVKSPESAIMIANALIQDGSPSPEPSPLP